MTIKDNENNYIIVTEKAVGQANIDSDKIYNVDGSINSPHVLAKRIHNFERATILKWLVLLLTLTIGILVWQQM